MIFNKRKGQFQLLRSKVLGVKDYEYLKIALGWNKDPVLKDPFLQQFNDLVDLNDRKVKDAQVILGACINSDPCTILEIGTSEGRMTKMMAENAPNSTIYTVNLPPEDEKNAGKNITHVLNKERIGWMYKEGDYRNIHQIYANTKTWQPEIPKIDVAFIDGCHDRKFVVNDTKKILPFMSEGGMILWHDFNLSLVDQYHWIKEVCLGVEELYAKGIISGRILHLEDSWVGLLLIN